MIHPTRRAIAGSAIALALLLGACSSSGGDDDAATTTAPEESTTTEAEVDDDAQERIAGVVISLDDLPDGWELQAEASDDDDDGPPLGGCAEVDREAELGRVPSDEFSLFADDGSFVVVESEAKVFTDAAAAEVALEPFSDAEVLACLSDAFAETLQGEPTGAFVEDDAITAEDLGVDQVEGVSGQFTETTASGEVTEIYTAILMMRSGDAGVQFSVFGAGAEPDLASLQPVILALAERLSEA